MKLLNYIFTLITLALLATSCSQDELPGNGEDAPVTGQTQTYTFTVSPDLTLEGDAATRSEGTDAEMPTRCFMQVIKPSGEAEEIITGEKDNTTSNYTFTVRLASNTEYTYLFWADNGSENPPTDLREVQYTPGTVAFAANAQGTLETVDKTVELKHVVAKVTLKTTTDVTFEDSRTIRLSASCASTYNVQTPSASSFEDKSISEKMTDASLAADSEVLTTYIIPNPDDKAVTFSAHDLAQTIDVVHLVANTNVTLQGDLSEDNPKWGATSEYAQKQINYFFKQKDGTTSEGTLDGGVYRFYLQEEKIIDLEAVLSAIFHKNVELDLTSGIIFDEVLDNDYTFAIWNNTSDKYLDISINDNKTYVVSYNPIYNGTYADFSVVSDKLKNQTE